VTNPYARLVEGTDPLLSLEETPRRIDALVRPWPRERDQRAHAPGKWTARQVLVHLAHIETVFAIRLRHGLTDDGYTVQPFEQDDWMAVEAPVTALDALDAYLALRRMNLATCRSLTAMQRARAFTHPEFGRITVEWLIGWCAGHERHHLPQIEAVARG